MAAAIEKKVLNFKQQLGDVDFEEAGFGQVKFQEIALNLPVQDWVWFGFDFALVI